MSSRMRRSTSKVAASSASTSCGAVVAAMPLVGTFRILFRTWAMGSSDAEIGLADVRLLQKLGRHAGADDASLLQHIGAIGDFERLEHVLLDQQHGRTLRPDAGYDAEHVVDDGRRQPERRLVEQHDPRPR